MFTFWYCMTLHVKKSHRPFLSVLHAEVIKYWRRQRLYCIYTRIPFFPNRTRQKELLTKQVSYPVILKCLFIICRLMPKVLRFSVTITTLHHQHQNLLSHQPALKHLNKKGFHTTAAFTCLGLVCVCLCRHIILYIISCTFCELILVAHLYKFKFSTFCIFVHFLHFLHIFYI